MGGIKPRLVNPSEKINLTVENLAGKLNAIAGWESWNHAETRPVSISEYNITLVPTRDISVCNASDL